MKKDTYSFPLASTYVYACVCIPKHMYVLRQTHTLLVCFSHYDIYCSV